MSLIFLKPLFAFMRFFLFTSEWYGIKFGKEISMKTHLIVLFSLTAFVHLVKAQTDTLHIHYFPNGDVSTYSYLNENREGKALAYSLEGEIIYEKITRRIHGSASVSFSHYENGMVFKANYSSYPDGGIQWYRTYTTFNDKGEVISEFNDNHEGPWDNRITLPQPVKKEEVILREQPTKPKPQKPYQEQEIMKCAMIHENKIEVINHSRFTIETTFIHKNKDTTTLLKPGGYFIGPNYISSQVSSPVSENVRFQFTPKRKRKKIINLVEQKTISATATIHIIHLFESEVED